MVRHPIPGAVAVGLFSKKSKSTTQEASNTSNQSTSTVTPNVPTFISDPTKTIAGNVNTMLGQGADVYAPTTGALQQQAFAQAPTLGQGTNADFTGARTALGGIGDVGAVNADAASLLDGGLDRYYNPFKDQVLNPVLNDYDEQSGMTRAAQSAAAARNKAFQGSRYGIQEAATEGELARGRATTESGLLSDMFKTSTGLAQSDAANRQQVNLANAASANQAAQANRDAQFQKAQQLAALGLSQGGEDRANLGVLAGLGATQTDQQNQQRQYPLQFQQQQEALLAGLNPELYTGKTVDTSGTQAMTGTSSTKNKASDTLGGLGQLAQIAAMFA